MLLVRGSVSYLFNFDSFKMQAVGRIGSYISKSVYTVSGTFHPFGGAVDIIVVEQPDGSYKSSPWYVRFGKFQGVLKSKEKAVGINVNDVEAEFHMHLDSKGEAFFMQEVEMEEGESAASPPYSSGEDMEGQPRWPLKSKSCNYDSKLYEPIVDERKALTRANTRQSQFFGFFGRRSPPEEAIDGKENAPDGKTQGRLEVAERAADLLDLRWSTNYGSPKCKKEKEKEKENNSSPVSDAVSTITEIDRNSVVDGSNHDEISLIPQTSYKHVKSNGEKNGVEIKSVTSGYIFSTSVGSVREHSTLSDLEPAMKYSLDKPDLKVTSVGVASDVAKSDSDIHDSVEKHCRLSDANFSTGESERDHTQSFYSSDISGSSGIELEVPFEEKSSSFCHGECREVCIHSKDQFTVVHKEKISVSREPVCGASGRLVPECYSQSVSRNPSTDSLKDIDSLSNAAASNSSYSTCVPMDDHNILGDKGKLDSHIQRSTSVPPCLGASKISEEELLLFGNLDDLGSNAKHLENGESDHEGVESRDAKCCSISSLDQSDINDYANDEYLDSRRLSSISSDVRMNEINNVQSEVPIRMARSLPSMDCFIQNLEASDPGYFSDASLCHDVNSCKEEKRRTAGEPPKPGKKMA